MQIHHIYITENGRRFVGHADDRGKVTDWRRVDTNRQFTYRRCQMCGRLIPLHPNHWYGHFNACLKKQTPVIMNP